MTQRATLVAGTTIIVALAVAAAVLVPSPAIPALLFAAAAVAGWGASRHRVLGPLPTVVRRTADLSLGLALVSAPLRSAVERAVYGGQADAEDYVLFGRRIADALGGGMDASSLARPVPGTGGVDYASGALALVGLDPLLIGGLASALLGFAARVVFVVTLHILVRGNEDRGVTVVMCALLLLPSLLYWPAALGKEGWMMLSVAFVCLGVARLSRGIPGILWLGVGGTMAASIRPHVALLLLLSVGTGWGGLTVYRSVKTDERLRPAVAARAVGIALLIGAATISVQDFFVLESVADVENVLEEVGTSAQRGTYRQDPGLRSAADVPREVLAVLARPHPLEADGMAMLLTSVELLVLWTAALVLWLRRGGRFAMVADLYVLSMWSYAALFIFAFSNMGNFGHLARQRIQLLPALVIALTVALWPAGSHADELDRGLRAGARDDAMSR